MLCVNYEIGMEYMCVKCIGEKNYYITRIESGVCEHRAHRH